MIKASLILILDGRRYLTAYIPGEIGFGFFIPRIDDFIKAFFLLVIPQLPLTLGNSIVATNDVARGYFGDRAKRVTAYSLSLGLGIANILSGLIGSMPVWYFPGVYAVKAIDYTQ